VPRRSASRMISLFPVPLNSWKISSSIRERCPPGKVATMVTEPPFSILRARPKKWRGISIAPASSPPDIVRPVPERGTLKARPRRVSCRRGGSVAAALQLDAHPGDVSSTSSRCWRTFCRWCSPGPGVHRAPEVGHRLRPLVDEGDDDPRIGRARGSLGHLFQRIRLPALAGKRSARGPRGPMASQVDDAHLSVAPRDVPAGRRVEGHEVLEARPLGELRRRQPHTSCTPGAEAPVARAAPCR